MALITLRSERVNQEKPTLSLPIRDQEHYIDNVIKYITLRMKLWKLDTGNENTRHPEDKG